MSVSMPISSALRLSSEASKSWTRLLVQGSMVIDLQKSIAVFVQASTRSGLVRARYLLSRFLFHGELSHCSKAFFRAVEYGSKPISCAAFIKASARTAYGGCVLVIVYGSLGASTT